MDLEEALEEIRCLKDELSDVKDELSDIENKLAIAVSAFDAGITRPEDVGHFISQAIDFFNDIYDIYQSI